MNPSSRRLNQTEGVVVALGSNLGESARLIRAAMRRLENFSSSPLLRSSLWVSAPVDCPPGSGDFINAAVALQPRPGETPETLLAQLLALEAEFGRLPKRVVNEARPLDLDLIAFGNERRGTSALTLPHPRAHTRRFVLQPLQEIIPEWILPGQTQTITELLAQLRADEPMRRLDAQD